ncbi:hypothetical protein [uncultured Sphingomonas sp.]|uniref:hypothetical protein n=1 Tax=uncultured Sphingomonas sp. TaxID=158754 RepID=UPI0025F81F4D|nr:hypothetical protein [uncultured Sphingomonas sp.]
MNDTTAATAESLIPDGVATITTIHFILIAIVAVAAIAVILIGMRLKHRRTHAARQVEENAQEAGLSVRQPDSAPLSEASLTERQKAPQPAPVPTPAAPPPPPPVMPAPTAPEEPAVVEEPLNDEPVAAAAPMAASPAAEASAAPADATRPEDQPITLLKGLGPKLTQKLAEHGITTVGDMAALSEAQAQALDAQLGAFSGRMARDRWLEQARLLAADDRAGFEAVFGRL